MSLLWVTLIQTSLHWEDKESNLAMLGNKIRSVRSTTELVILPEMFSTGFSMRPELFAEEMNGPSVEWMKQMAAENNVVLTGSLMIKEADQYFNRMIWMLPNGKCAYYDKRHLFGLAAEDEHYSAGNKRLIASLKGFKINLQVCYDLRFPVWSRQQVNAEGDTAPEFDVLIYVANWPEKRSTAWKTLLRARAIENQCYVIGVNRVGNDGNLVYHSGDSAVIDPQGNYLYEKSNADDIQTIELDKEKLNDFRKQFPFWKDADRFDIIS